MYTNKDDEGEERRKMKWVGTCTVCPTANEGERVDAVAR
jgi:hypothetical protein